MPSKRRQQQPPLQTAIKLFVSGALFLVGAIVIPLVSLNCSYIGPVRFCIETTYYGLDARTFGIVLGFFSVLCLAGGVFYLRRHKQMLAARRSAAVTSAPQQFAPQQPGAYPPMQNTIAPAHQWYPRPAYSQGAYPPMQNTITPGGYAGNPPFQPPSKTFPQS